VPPQHRVEGVQKGFAFFKKQSLFLKMQSLFKIKQSFFLGFRIRRLRFAPPTVNKV
jgi:hypothetical protein